MLTYWGNKALSKQLKERTALPPFFEYKELYDTGFFMLIYFMMTHITKYQS
jgi:hypothetical protein